MQMKKKNKIKAAPLPDNKIPEIIQAYLLEYVL
jgi:hypothetical protein